MTGEVEVGDVLFAVVMLPVPAARPGRAVASVATQSVGSFAVVPAGDVLAGGPPAARYVAFIDERDVWLPHRLELALAGLARSSVTVCRARRIDEVPARGLAMDVLATELTTPSVVSLDAGLVDDATVREVVADSDRWWMRLRGDHDVAVVDETGVIVGAP